MEDKDLTIEEIKRTFTPPTQIEDKAYIFGSAQLTGEILRPDENWSEYVPSDLETQNENGFDPDDCLSFGLIHQTEFVIKEKFNADPNYSERFLALGSGTKPPGNDPQSVYEWARKNGFIDESLFPNNAKTVDEYYALPPFWQNLLSAGHRWLEAFALGHDWLSKGTSISLDTLKEALKYSPVGIGVYAWARNGDIYYRPTGGEDIHWVVLFKIDDYCYILDSYAPYIKKLDLNFGFSWAKRIAITSVEDVKKEVGLLQRILNLLSQWASLIAKKTQ